MTPQEQQKFVDDVTSTGFHSMRLSDAQKKVAAKLAPLFALVEAGQVMRKGLKNSGHLNTRGGIAWDAALANLQEALKS